jgi:hypothetical protein
MAKEIDEKVSLELGRNPDPKGFHLVSQLTNEEGRNVKPSAATPPRIIAPPPPPKKKD